MSPPIRHDFAVMGTVVSFRIGRPGPAAGDEAWDLVRRAEAWFLEVEAVCSRFEPESELSRLCARPGQPVPAGDLLYRAVDFALSVAEASGGAFDPTVGGPMAARGFDRSWRSGRRVHPAPATPRGTSFRDVRLDPVHGTIELTRPLGLDLGGVAKGLAIDMAARELRALGGFTISAGGDLYVAGTNEDGAPWSVGVRHPREEHRLIESFPATDTAVCTSGDYERRAGGEPHVIDPRTGTSAIAAASATVAAPSAMAADALATAALVLGPAEGLALLEREGAEGVIFTRDLERFTTRGWGSGPVAGRAAAGA